MTLPECDGARVGRDDAVELHGAKAGLPGICRQAMTTGRSEIELQLDGADQLAGRLTLELGA